MEAEQQAHAAALEAEQQARSSQIADLNVKLQCQVGLMSCSNAASRFMCHTAVSGQAGFPNDFWL